MINQLKRRMLSSTVFCITLLSVAQFSIPQTVLAASTSNNTNNVQNLIDSIKEHKASNADETNKLFDYAVKGDKKAIKQIKSFDCFNKNLVGKYINNVSLAPNTSKTIVFDDGSKIVYENTTRTVELDNKATKLSKNSISPMTTYPTTAKSTACTYKEYIGPLYVGYEGGTAYWRDLNRDSCHIISTSPSIAGPLLSVTSSSSRILENNQIDSTYKVTASFEAVQYGIVLGSFVGSDIIYVDTGGISGFETNGLK